MINFDWTDSTFDKQTRQAFEEVLDEFQDISARHRLDIGIKNDFRVKLTELDGSPAYSQSPTTTINLKEGVTVELALLQKNCNITILPFNKYVTLLFARRKPNAKIRLFVDLRKISFLISDDYINNNHPVSTLTDAAQQMASKNYFVDLIVPNHITVYKCQTNEL